MLVQEFTYTDTPIAAQDWSLKGLYFHRKGTVYKVCGTLSPLPYCPVRKVEDKIKNLDTGATAWLVREKWAANACLAILVQPKPVINAKLPRKKRQ